MIGEVQIENFEVRTCYGGKACCSIGVIFILNERTLQQYCYFHDCSRDDVSQRTCRLGKANVYKRTLT